MNPFKIKKQFLIGGLVLASSAIFLPIVILKDKFLKSDDINPEPLTPSSDINNHYRDREDDFFTEEKIQEVKKLKEKSSPSESDMQQINRYNTYETKKELKTSVVPWFKENSSKLKEKEGLKNNLDKLKELSEKILSLSQEKLVHDNNAKTKVSKAATDINVVINYYNTWKTTTGHNWKNIDGYVENISKDLDEVEKWINGDRNLKSRVV